MKQINFARVDSETKKVTFITQVSFWRVKNEYGEVDSRLANNHLKQTILESKDDMWLDITEKKCGLEYTYDENLNIFVPPKIYDSWILNTETCEWEPPIPKPESNFSTEPFYDYTWNEETFSWEQIF